MRLGRQATYPRGTRISLVPSRVYWVLEHSVNYLTMVPDWDLGHHEVWQRKVTDAWVAEGLATITLPTPKGVE